jgi:hypothetical protein
MTQYATKTWYTTMHAAIHTRHKYDKTRYCATTYTKPSRKVQYDECIEALDMYINKYRYIVSFDYKTIIRMREIIFNTQLELHEKAERIHNMSPSEYRRYTKYITYFTKKHGHTKCHICGKEILKYHENQKYCILCYRLHLNFMPHIT